jgi:hypothetical protein
MYEPLKTWFISQQKYRTTIFNFFPNGRTKFWLLFLHNQLDNFTKQIQYTERTVYVCVWCNYKEQQ